MTLDLQRLRHCDMPVIGYLYGAVPMRKTLEVVNQMQKEQVIGKYAIGGAIAATFYLEPVSTFDIDIFISFRSTPGALIITLSPIYEYLAKLGYKAEHEHVVVADWQVQFLPADDPLCAESLAEAVEISFDGIKTWVMTAEHLMAIALRTGRSKDFLRLEQFVRGRAFSAAKLEQILARHQLLEKWAAFKSRIAGGADD
jgi:hypothetical protein